MNKRIFDDINSFQDEENDDSSPGEHTYQHKTGATLFLVDARRNMFSSKFDEENSALITCFKCIRNAMRDMIFKEEKNYCGIILLGTKTKNNPLLLNNITIIQELNLVEAKHILTIDKVTQDIECSKYETLYGFSSFSLGDAFWLSNHIFAERSQALNKRIILFTNDDNTVGNENNDYNRAMAGAQDMHKNHILLEVVQLGEKFNGNKFYKKLLQASHSDINYTIPDPVVSLKEMEKNVKQKVYSHLTLARLPFVIGENFQIAVSVHFLVKKMKNPFKVKLSKSTNKKVGTKLQLFETESGSLVDEDNIIKSQIIGQKRINFNLKELKGISQCGKAELRLIGFKPSSVISIENFVKPCAFIYPDEIMCKGSSIFFTALLKRCIAKQVVPICTMCLKTNSASRYVALMAQTEGSTASGVDLPQGFVVFFLPFAEELRTYEDKPTEVAEPEQVELAKKVIKKLRFKYNIECFQNPKLKSHWAGIEALALDLKEKEEVIDTTYPNYELISARIGEAGKEFMKAVYSEDYDPEEARVGRKRKAGDANTKISSESVEALIRQGEGERLTNDVLKAYLASVGEGKGLSKIKKSDLLEKIRQHLNLN